jgi:tetratricopeptide (TPR) repeat protein
MMNLIDEVGCNYDLWELEEAIRISKIVIEQCSNKCEVGYENYKVEASSYLAMCLSLEDILDSQEECEILLRKALDCDDIKVNNWCSVHRLLFAGNSYKNLSQLLKSEELYLKAIIWTEEKGCHLNVKGNANIGLAELLRSQKNIDEAMKKHQESIEILDKVGAKCGLAEAYFQFGLTYQAKGEYEKAEEYKEKALKLFEQMEAPKQKVRVNRAFEQGAKQ